jgi:DNA-binding NarL/FixJ family response regulator
MPTTVLIVDDHPTFRACAREFLEAEGFEVVGEAEDGRGCLRYAEELRPDVVLLDVVLPDLNGFEVAEQLTHSEDAPAVVLTSSRDAEDFGALIGSCGARGFIPKDELSRPALDRLLP